MKIDWLNPEIKSQTDESCDLPDIITPNYGLGITFKDDKGIEYTTTKVNDPRTIIVDVNTYRGISFDAEHYYAKLSVYGFPFKFTENGETQTLIIGGYFERFVPKEAQGFEIQILRLLTESEIKKGSQYDPERWIGYRVGSTTNAFNTEKELYNAIIDCIKTRFSGIWNVEISGFDNETLNQKFQTV